MVEILACARLNETRSMEAEKQRAGWAKDEAKSPLRDCRIVFILILWLGRNKQNPFICGSGVQQEYGPIDLVRQAEYGVPTGSTRKFGFYIDEFPGDGHWNQEPSPCSDQRSRRRSDCPAYGYACRIQHTILDA